MVISPTTTLQRLIKKALPSFGVILLIMAFLAASLPLQEVSAARIYRKNKVYKTNAGSNYQASPGRLSTSTVTTNSAAAPATTSSTAPVVNNLPANTELQPVRVMTWNILGSNHANGRHNFVERTKLASRIISGQEGIEPIDIVGMQEIEHDQYSLFKRYLSNYNPVPTQDPHNAVFYRTERFRLIGSDIINYPFYGDYGKNRNHGHAVWARLQDKASGKYITLSNWHYVAWNEDGGSDKWGAYKRLWSAQISNLWAKRVQKAHPNDIILLTGDLNSTNNIRNKPDPPLTPKPKDPALNNNRDLLPYCVLTKWDSRLGSVLQDSMDMYETSKGQSGHSGHCPDRDNIYVRSQNVDWIYTSPRTANVVYWDQLKNTGTDYASDHYPIITTVTAKQ